MWTSVVALSVDWNITNGFIVKRTDVLVAESLMNKDDTGLHK